MTIFVSNKGQDPTSSDTMNQEQTDFFELLRGGETPVPIAEPSQEGLPADDAAEPDITLEKSTGGEENAGRLLPEARRALVALLRHGVIMAADKRRLFEILCRHQNPIRAHLTDMYLGLVVDEQAGLALLLQRQPEDTDDEEEVSTLISRRPLSLYDTLLLLVLRKHYQEREATGEQRVMIDIDRIENALRPFLPLTHSSRSDRRQLSGALKTMKERRILSAVRGEEDRFEITPVIRYVVSAEFLEKLLEEYQTLANENANQKTEDE